MIHVDVHRFIDRPIEDVFARLADIDGYRAWLPRSVIYRDSHTGGGGEATDVGTVFSDETSLGRLTGSVTQFDPPTHIAFAQRLERNGTVIFESRPAYRLESHDGGTMVHHSGEAETSRALSVFEPVVWLFAQYERRRVVRALKHSLEGPRAAGGSRGNQVR